MTYHLAVDIGASSGRHILGWVENGRICTEEVYRFKNGMAEKNGHLTWDVQGLFGHIVAGLKQCAALGKLPATMGVDTWGVDFVLLDENDQLVGDAVAYRDKRNIGMDAEVEKIISFEALYHITGIQKQVFNSIYQLMALKLQEPKKLAAAQSLLMMPDYFHFLLTGVKKQEYTTATTGALVDAESKSWAMDVIEQLGFPARLFGPLSVPGTPVGPLSAAMRQQVGFDSMVVLPATHDTASAYLAVPARDDNAVTISSGTWSLLGTESPVPIITQKGLEANFANEGGYGYRYRFLKNIMGLWMIQSIKGQNEEELSFAQLEQLARDNADYTGIVDVNSHRFMAPQNMRKAIVEECEATGVAPPQSLGQVMQCVYQSLATCYKNAVQNLQLVTGRSFTSINIVGGGCKDGYLNSLTAKLTGLPVYAGPSEGTTIGNLAAQMLAQGSFGSVQEVRNAIKQSFEIKKYEP